MKTGLFDLLIGSKVVVCISQGIGSSVVLVGLSISKPFIEENKFLFLYFETHEGMIENLSWKSLNDFITFSQSIYHSIWYHDEVLAIGKFECQCVLIVVRLFFVFIVWIFIFILSHNIIGVYRFWIWIKLESRNLIKSLRFTACCSNLECETN